jgi:hypothetical protein
MKAIDSLYSMCMFFLRLYSAMLVLAMILGCESPTRIPVQQNLSIVDLSGQMQRPLQPCSAIANVIILITNDCPISNGYAPEIDRIIDRFSRQNVAFFVVDVDSTIDDKLARRHAREFGYSCPVLVDRRHELARSVGATVTPEAAVINRNGEVVYCGRIDDRYIDFGKKRLEPNKRDLIDAIEAVIDGRAVADARTRAVGCPIPGVPESIQ